ncbi:late competence development ComFB family protein [Teredinibacter haidensis]|mgnify:CR=1 FL=1|uniref:late competence development ComFB family protein n=1 Tax=Teredinibacter haidensis TaxID=2731755 RepID=UPI000948B0EC|nr:late competence development ComFB family protein [Teredinibacter haidensis]
MLLGAGRHRGELISAQDSVHNYYEHLVISQLLRANDRANQDAEFMADVTCVALNRLPPRYVRHDVDMTFFLSPAELEEMSDKVALAVNDAVDYVLSREALHTTDAEETKQDES